MADAIDSNKTQAILTILRARGPMTLDQLQPPLEEAISQIYGRDAFMGCWP